MTANVIAYRGRNTIRELGKVLGFGDDALDRFSSLYANGDFPETLGLQEQLKLSKQSEEFRARQILLQNQADGEAVKKLLASGASFDALAMERSSDAATRFNGGDLGYFTKDRMVPEFSEAAFKLEKGKYTEAPVKTQFGYHVIRLDDVRDAQLPKFEDVKPQISQQLMQQKMAKFQEELRGKAKVE